MLNLRPALFSLVVWFLSSAAVFAQASVSVHLTMGNPSGAQKDETTANNYLMVKDQFVLSYNKSKGTPNWVSWHLTKKDVTVSKKTKGIRLDDFRADSTLPDGWYKVHEGSYEFEKTGFHRGHLCPSADRQATKEDNSATFVMTNMMPQSPKSNSGVWARMEGYCQELARQGNEMYIIAGPHGTRGQGTKGFKSKLDNKKVTVPAHTWKVVVVLKDGDDDVNRVDGQTRVIAVIIPNEQKKLKKDWSIFRVSIDDVEDLTGHTFLSEVPKPVADTLRKVVDQVEVKKKKSPQL